MQSGALRALEFDRIVEAVCRFAQTPAGLARLRGSRRSWRRAAWPGARCHGGDGRFLSEGTSALRAPEDLEATLDLAGGRGTCARTRALLTLGGLPRLDRVDVRGDPPRPRRLSGAAGDCDTAATFDPEIADIRRKIDPAGEVVDDASPALRSIRDRLRKQRTRLRGTLESYLRGKDTSKYLQQQIVTDRNGRYVLVVRAEHRGAIPGIVHGSSGSGASLFLEPLSTVEINNEIVALEQQEAEEVRRILLALSDALRRRGTTICRGRSKRRPSSTCCRRGRSFSELVDGVGRRSPTDGRLELRAARHPLLIPALQRHLRHRRRRSERGTGRSGRRREPRAGPRGRPADSAGHACWSITGPNTGGKTVALKTAGLLALMAQVGPADSGRGRQRRCPVFRIVFADIGDEQSIAESLSTFSGHIANVVAMDQALALPALVLLDEAGAGTDPAEGGALAMAIIEHFRLRGATVIATTHYDSLKSYASTTEGVVPAGFGFDPKTFAPTYRLGYGSPGSSLAFEIATRLGLPPSIIERARTHRASASRSWPSTWPRSQRDMQTLEHERRLVARERETLAEHEPRCRSASRSCAPGREVPEAAR